MLPKKKIQPIAVWKIHFFSVYKLHVLHKEHSTETAEGLKIWREGGTVFWMGFYADISWESRCSSEIKVWGHLCQILVVFEVPAQPRVKGCLDIAKTTKIWERILKSSFFFRVSKLIKFCIGHGVGKGIKKLLKFARNELRFWFHWGILIPRKCPHKTPFKAQCPPPTHTQLITT